MFIVRGAIIRIKYRVKYSHTHTHTHTNRMRSLVKDEMQGMHAISQVSNNTCHMQYNQPLWSLDAQYKHTHTHTHNKHTYICSLQMLFKICTIHNHTHIHVHQRIHKLPSTWECILQVSTNGWNNCQLTYHNCIVHTYRTCIYILFEVHPAITE